MSTPPSQNESASIYKVRLLLEQKPPSVPNWCPGGTPGGEKGLAAAAAPPLGFELSSGPCWCN